MGISQYRLAHDISVPPRRINKIVHGTRARSADTALRLARYFGTTERFRLNLQARFDLEAEQDRLGDRLEKEGSVLRAASYRQLRLLRLRGQRMDSEPVIVRTYPTEIAAEIARAALDAHGIAALVQSADAAGLLRYAQGVQLVVRRGDLALAREVLDPAPDRTG